MLPFHTFSLGFSFMKIACMTPLGTGVQYDEVTCLQHPRKLLASPPTSPAVYKPSATLKSTTNAMYIGEALIIMTAADVLFPQHGRAYETLLARAATSKTEPGMGPWL